MGDEQYEDADVTWDGDFHGEVSLDIKNVPKEIHIVENGNRMHVYKLIETIPRLPPEVWDEMERPDDNKNDHQAEEADELSEQYPSVISVEKQKKE
jgi:hypothetical protein